MSKRTGYWLAILILLFSALLSSWSLNRVPGGLTATELTNIRLTETVRRGQIGVFYEIDGVGYETMYEVGLAAATTLIGNGILSYRIVSVAMHLVTLALIFTLGTRLISYRVGLLAMAAYAVSFWALLLSRLILPEATLPLITTIVMVALARALPVYHIVRHGTSYTLAFAVLGVSLGLSLYVHPVGLLLVLMSLIYTVYTVVSVRPLSRRRLSYIGFALLMLIIIAIPYFVSSFRLPQLAANARIVGDLGGVLQSFLTWVGALAVTGDANPAYNIPGRPLFNLPLLMAIAIGLLMCLRHIRQPRYAMPIIALATLSLFPLLSPGNVDFVRISPLLPVFALLFAIGVVAVVDVLPQRARPLGVAVGVAIVIVTGAQSALDLYGRWITLPEVQTVYRRDLGALAHLIDTTSDQYPTVLCYPSWRQQDQRPVLTDAQLVLLLMNRPGDDLRFVDCRNGLVMINGGVQQQWIFPDPTLVRDMRPTLLSWITLATPFRDGYVAENAVYRFDDPEALANRLGVYTTTTPANLTVGNTIDPSPIPPPLRFGGNITWLGYEPPVSTEVSAGDTVPIVNYWRIEGDLVDDLLLFTHIMSDPVSMVANRDIITADPRRLQPRDLFVQITDVPLSPYSAPGEYRIELGAYRSFTGERQPVLVDGVPSGNRIFIYGIRIVSQGEAGS